MFEEMQRKQDEKLDEIQKKQDERFDEIKQDLSHMKEAQRSSMEERIRYLVSHWYNKGMISMAEKANLIDMWKMYVGIGGNGNLDTEMAILGSIPVEKHKKEEQEGEASA